MLNQVNYQQCLKLYLLRGASNNDVRKSEFESVSFFSVTGYIGGETLSQLLASPTTKDHSYSALLRSAAKAPIVESLGVRPVLGTLNDKDLLIEEARKADVVIHTADSSDHVASCEALLEGMRKRSAEGKETIYIHVVKITFLTSVV